MTAVSRLIKLRNPFQTRGIAAAATMANLNINSKYKMLSGYEIPVLGYGVSIYPPPFPSPSLVPRT